MQISIPKETHANEKRVPVIPETAGKLVKMGAKVIIESGMGLGSGYQDEDYTKVGAEVETDREKLLKEGDIVLRLRKPEKSEIKKLKKGCIHVSYLDPFNELELVEEFSKEGVNAICMELIPRSTKAQKMDALSSQANLAGYTAVIIAADHLDKIFPMMMTPSGTIKPSRVFIIGAGVAGLQAIATAKRLGARVDAFDTRPVVEEQVKSLGGKFLKIDLGDTGQTKDGYAKALTEEQLAIQREAMAKHCSLCDVVITTAQVFGRKAPVIVTADMVKRMKPGSVLVDLAVETGGNVEGSKVDEVVDVDGVRIIGLGNLPGRVAINASQMYSQNLFNLIDEFWDKENKTFKLDLESEIMQGCLLTHDNEVRHEKIKSLLEEK
ncbi:Re/Si-specific NAD(P)(+) transhydrogenase subunit alpha [Candidatus Uabimicrobium amorphum]|uniref:proton-translocating NAD(P)(+) transhydrogenase n=1 Tax=Uabimicrobium amorphum TaxID=2596890 RepID=A0A5S9IWR4_UABAM|nr:Re/Si-specific NAD(P)(+) transhydrogenase subunit alpha [Candidatus Uabimicrobium amorphum]BBM87945.1 NAD(P) transhydrogenase subunit alpha [Candidatus Uabimicrobium amorphum]